MTTTESVLAHKVQWERGSIYKPCGDPDCSLEHMTFPDLRALCTWNMLMDSNGWKYLGLRGRPSIDQMPKALNRAESHICRLPETWKGVCVLRDAPQVLKDGVFDAYAASRFPTSPLKTLADFELLVTDTHDLRLSVVEEMWGMPLELISEDIRDQWVPILSSIAPDLVRNVSLQEAVERFRQHSVNEESIKMAASAYARLDRQDAKKTARDLISAAGISLGCASTVSWADQKLDNWHKGMKLELDAYRNDHDDTRAIAVLPPGPGGQKYWVFGVSAVKSFWTDERGLRNVVYEAGKRKSDLLRDYLTNVYFHPGDARYLSIRGTEETLKTCCNPHTKQNFTDKEAALLGTLLDAMPAMAE